MVSAVQLNEQFGITPELRFHDHKNGLQFVTVANSHSAATIALQGAQILNWAPRREKPVIWLSPEAKFAPGKSVRGGIPVCWPWFGAHEKETSFPAHGFARTAPWDVLATEQCRDGATKIAFRLPFDESARKQWPFACELELHVTIGVTLDIDLLTRNTGDTAFTVGDALHTYFTVSDARKISIHGLGDAPYFDKADGMKKKIQKGAVTIDQEVDRLYQNTIADCLINDPLWNRRIRVHKHHSASTVVWNPWIEKSEKLGDMGSRGYLNMVCVESTNAGDDVVRIDAGDSHRLRVEYGVEPLNS